MTKAVWSGDFSGTFLRITGREDGIIRVTRDLDGVFREPVLSAVCPCPPGEWAEDGGAFETRNLRIRVNPESGAISFFRKDGKLILRERQDHPAELERTAVVLHDWQGEIAVTETAGADGIRASAEPSKARTDRNGVRGTLHFKLQEGEALYGLGSHEEGFGNLRGRTRILYQHNLKAVVPVLVSTNGWAILFDMGCMMQFSDGAEGAGMYIDCADTADWYLIYGDGSYRSLAEKIRELTGPASMLPKYAFGFTQSKERYVSAEELTAAAAEYRRRRIPLDLIVQDWQTWPDGQWGLKRFDRSRFPEGFTDRLHGMHVRVMLSVWPHMQGDRNTDRDEMQREGCMLGNRSTYDAFREKAREIYWCRCGKAWPGTESMPGGATVPNPLNVTGTETSALRTWSGCG